MNVGEKIKQLRTDKNLTQPQLAEAIGIEQSYLSKLENDKSVPSADIFQAILKALAVDVGNFLEGIDEKIIHRQLRQIPEVANYLNAGVAYKIHNIKKWLYGSAVACVIGLTLIVASYKGLLFSDKQYNYVSEGVILEGEPTNIYRTHNTIAFSRLQANEITTAEMLKLENEFAIKRIREERMLLTDYRGDDFMLPVEGGSRIYHLTDTAQNERVENRFLMLLGVLLAFSGLLGFFVEFRLRRI